MGSSRNARATVAMMAVQTANNNCIESKKKNITRRDTDAPRGRQRETGGERMNKNLLFL